MKMTKKVLSVLLSLMLVLGAVSVGGMSVSADDVISSVSDGLNWNETQQRYEISNYAGLKAYASIVNGTDGQTWNPEACAVLMADIDASASDPEAEGYDPANDWTPIGNGEYSEAIDYEIAFKGTFDGRGHKITGLTTPSDYGYYAGLFGYVMAEEENGVYVGGIVKNVGLEGGKIFGKEHIGGVVGMVFDGTVTNCYNTGEVTVKHDIDEEDDDYDYYKRAGGVVGESFGGTVTNCFNTGAVSGERCVGGVVGENMDGNVINCFNTGNVSGKMETGGVAGSSFRSKVEKCYNTGYVSGDYFAGGVTGEDSYSEIQNCYNTGDVSGSNYVGGVTGKAYTEVTVRNCYNTGNIFGEDYCTGGVTGQNMDESIVENCYNTGTVYGDEYVGGVTGGNVNQSAVKKCYNSGGVSGRNNVGSVVGVNDEGSVANCCYDKSVCTVANAVGSDIGRVTNVFGLTTAQMTGTNALANMTGFDSTDWLVKANGQADGRNTFYFCYPHLKGFDFAKDDEKIDLTEADENCVQMTADEIKASDWPARLEITVNTPEFTYTGEPECISTEDIIVVSGSMGVPDEFADKTVTYSKWNKDLREWDEIYGSFVESPGRYKLTVTEPDETEILFERSFTVLETGDLILTVSAVNGNTSATGADAGDYEEIIKFTKYSNITVTVPYTINPAQTEISVSVGDISCGETEKATVTAAAEIGDDFTVKLEKKKSSDEWEEVDALPSGITNGTQFEISGLSAGDYRLTASYAGGRNYTACSDSDEFSVNTLDPGMTLTISPEEPVWGDDITITATLPENATGTVTFRLDEADTGVEVTVENGKAVYAIEGKSIEVDNYTVLASYSGGERYNSVSEELPLKIKKAETEVHITVEPENPLSGQEISITVTVDGDATISPDLSSSGTINNTKGATLFIDGSSMDSKYSGTNTVTFNVPGLDAGEHNIEVVYNGDEHYKSADSETVTINIGRAEPEISVTVMLSAVNGEAVAPGESVTAEVGDKLTFAGKAANNGNVTLTNVIIHDRLTGTTYNAGTLKPGEVSEDTLVLYTVTAADAAAGKIIDSVKVTAEVDDGEDVSSVAEAEVSVRTEYKVTYIVDGEELTKMDAIFGQSVPQPRTPQKEGYTFAWVDEIPETMPAEDVTINGTFTIIKYTATFVKEDGTELETREYDIETTSIDEPDVPAKQGYEGKWTAYTLAAADITIKAEYTAIEYTATFVDENGETVAEIPYTVESGSIEAPAVPGKEGYNGEWEEYELTPGGITVKPVYTPADICPLDNEYHGTSFRGRLVKFFHTVIWKAFNLLGMNIYIKIW